MNEGWIYLLVGIIGEVIWVLTLKPTEGFTRVSPSLINLSVAVLNIIVLSKAFNLLPTALSYSIWVGASAVAIAACSWYLQGESMTLPKVICMLFIVLGIVGLKYLSGVSSN